MASVERTPASNLPLFAGTWIAILRVRRGLTRHELAERADVSYALLTKVEAAVELASPEVTAACAGALGVESSLLASPYPPASDSDLQLLATERIRAEQDVLDLPPNEGVHPRLLPELATEVRQVAGWTEAARYGSVAVTLPRLVTDLRIAVLTLTGEDKQTARRLLTEVNRIGFQVLAAAFLAGTVATGTVAIASDRAVTTAPQHQGHIAASILPRPQPGVLSRIALLGCGVLGWLLGFGLGKLYFSGHLFLLILGGCLGVAVAWLMYWLMATHGPDHPATLKTLHGYVGFQAAILMLALSTAHGVWIGVIIAWVLCSWMNAVGGRHPFGLAAMYGYLAVITAIVMYRIMYLHWSWWFLPAWAAAAIVVTYVFPRLPRPTRRFPAPGSGAVMSVLLALHLPLWVAALGGSLCGVVYLLPALSLRPGSPGDFGDVFPPVAPH